jgi:hypothetical protein
MGQNISDGADSYLQEFATCSGGTNATIRDCGDEIGQPEFRGQELAARFTCIAPRLEKVPDPQIACDSNDGWWSVQYIAVEPDTNAFMTVLRNIVWP